MKINILQMLCIVFISVSAFASPQDSIQEDVLIDNPPYIGYRIAITNLSVNSTKNKGFLNVEFTAINTGRKDLLFGKKTTPPPNLVVSFDESLARVQLSNYVEDIKEAVSKSNFHIVAGKIAKRKTIKIPVKQMNLPKQTKEEVVADALENPRLEKAKEKTEFTAKAAPVDDFENSLISDASRQYDENACSDLRFESIKIIKKSKNKVTLEYTIVNDGSGPAKLIKDRKKEKQNMALQAYMSSRDRVTKSSFSFDGDFINKGLKDSNGRLFPGEKYTGTIKLGIQKMTKFTPYVILELDPYLSVNECDKKNNKFAVKVGAGAGIGN